MSSLKFAQWNKCIYSWAVAILYANLLLLCSYKWQIQRHRLEIGATGVRPHSAQRSDSVEISTCDENDIWSPVHLKSLLENFGW